MDTCEILINDAFSSGTNNQLVKQENNSATEKDFTSDDYMDDLSPGSLSIARFLGEDSDYKHTEISDKESMGNSSLEKWLASSQSDSFSQHEGSLSKHQSTAARKDIAEAAKDLNQMQNIEQLKAAEGGTLHMDEKGAASVVCSQTDDVVFSRASTGLREDVDCSQWSDAAEEDMVNAVDGLLQSEAVGGEDSGESDNVPKAVHVRAADVTVGSLVERHNVSYFHEEPGDQAMPNEEKGDEPSPGTSTETWVKVNSAKSGTVNIKFYVAYKA